MTICAQILEFPDWRVFRRRFKAAPGWGGGKPEPNKLNRQMFIRCFWRHDCASAQERANTRLPKDSHKPIRD
jgi:hypothetical protein